MLLRALIFPHARLTKKALCKNITLKYHSFNFRLDSSFYDYLKHYWLFVYAIVNIQVKGEEIVDSSQYLLPISFQTSMEI